MQLRPYQDLAVNRTLTHWARGKRRVCLVAPTGAGKTEMALGVIRRAVAAGRRVLWLTHTKDLVAQTARRLGAGIVAAGHARDESTPIQVASIQTLLAREWWEPFDVVVFDECHHVCGDKYGALFQLWTGAYLLGLTATPQRSDGRPLRPYFDELVVAAQHSELLRDGHLVPVRLFRPAKELDRGIACDVVEAAVKHAGHDRCGFVYLRSISDARHAAGLLTLAGFPSTCVDEATDPAVRRQALTDLAAGQLRFITNVDTMSEGVDVPSASIAILGANIGHVSTYIQRIGRVVRSFSGKRDAVICDLPGLSHRSGWMPLSDLEYSLDGQGIRPALSALSLRCCLKCGFVWESGAACPECGWRAAEQPKPAVRIYNQELLEVYCGSQTPDWAKRAEWDRLQKLADGRQLTDYFAVTQYRKLFNEDPPVEIRPDATRQQEMYRKYIAEMKTKSYRPGWASWKFRATYGAAPPRAWQKEEFG